MAIHQSPELESPAISSVIEKRFKDVDALEQLRVGDKNRIYCLLIQEHDEYNILLVLGLSEHQYKREKEARHRLNELAKQSAEDIKDMSKEGLEKAISEENFFNASELQEILNEEL